jgi:hypothetical protein
MPYTPIFRTVWEEKRLIMLHSLSCSPPLSLSLCLYSPFDFGRFFSFLILYTHVRWVPCHHGMARPQVADGGDGLQFWRLAANILNKQSRTADKGWSSSLGVGRGANNSSP